MKQHKKRKSKTKKKKGGAIGIHTPWNTNIINPYHKFVRDYYNLAKNLPNPYHSVIKRLFKGKEKVNVVEKPKKLVKRFVNSRKKKGSGIKKLKKLAMKKVKKIKRRGGDLSSAIQGIKDVFGSLPSLSEIADILKIPLTTITNYFKKSPKEEYYIPKERNLDSIYNEYGFGLKKKRKNKKC